MRATDHLPRNEWGAGHRHRHAAPASSFRANKIVAGRPAAVTASSCSGAAPCCSGAVATLKAVIRVPGEPSVDMIATLQLQAFFGPGSANDAELQMRQMLDHARAASLPGSPTH
jgi:hypothetical protein